MCFTTDGTTFGIIMSTSFKIITRALNEFQFKSASVSFNCCHSLWIWSQRFCPVFHCNAFSILPTVQARQCGIRRDSNRFLGILILVCCKTLRKWFFHWWAKKVHLTRDSTANAFWIYPKRIFSLATLANCNVM